MASTSPSSTARSARPEWFDNILDGFRPEVRHPHLDGLSPEQRDPRNWDQQTTDLMLAEKNRWKRGKSEIWPTIERLDLDEGRFGDLASACWSYGFAKINRSLHVEAETSAIEKENRRKAVQLAKEARKVARTVESLQHVPFPPGARDDRDSDRLRSLLLDAVYRVSHYGRLRSRFPVLVRDLTDFADAIDQCTKSRVDATRKLETQAEVCRMMTEYALLGAVTARGEPTGIRGIGELLLYGKQTHWEVAASMINLLHPTLVFSRDGILRDHRTAKERRDRDLAKQP